MSTAIYNMSINAGEDFYLTLVIKDSLGVLIDLTGKTFAGQIREAWDSVDPSATFVCTVSNQTTNKGEVVIKLPHTQSNLMPFTGSKNANKRPTTDFIYDIEQTDLSGDVTRILQGTATFSPQVTR